MTVVASNYARKENDLYQTEPWATEALLRHYPVFDAHIWEPAAGKHLMADVLREVGCATVFTSDMKTYDRPHNEIIDFLKDCPRNKPARCDAIITNPPYGKGNRDAAKFARLALARCSGMVALLLTAKFDFGKTRMDLFRDNPRFSAKIALVDRIQWFPGASTGTEDHAWYVWMAEHCSPPTLLYEGRADNAATRRGPNSDTISDSSSSTSPRRMSA